MATKKRLGRGLGALLGDRLDEKGLGEEAGAVITDVMKAGVDAIRPNPMQPRSGFDARGMNELAESVREVGILQPLIVRQVGTGYELITGERRLRAAEMVGLESVPVIVRDASDDEMLTLALIENVQREDLNPIEKGKGFKWMIERFELTQEEAAKRIGKDRSTLANFIRLLDLPEAVQYVVSRGTISMGHARALLGLAHASAQQALALRIEEEGLSVREAEQIVAQARSAPATKRRAVAAKSAHIRDLEGRAREHLGTKVSISEKRGRGRLIIYFHSNDDFQRILDVLGISG